MLVMLVKNDGENTPPLGCVGTIVDTDGDDLVVDFPNWPCPAGPDPTWLCPEHWLMLIDRDNGSFIVTEPEPQYVQWSATADPTRW